MYVYKTNTPPIEGLIQKQYKSFFFSVLSAHRHLFAPRMNPVQDFYRNGIIKNKKKVTHFGNNRKANDKDKAV